jgi:5'(3')-deoxyribonucleotidase
MKINAMAIENKRKSVSDLVEKYEHYIILDMTSKKKWIKFSPFYPHGNILVPYNNRIMKRP